MGIEEPPIRSTVLDKGGFLTRPWRDWLQTLTDAINNTNTIDVVIQVTPTVETEEITYINGAE